MKPTDRRTGAKQGPARLLASVSQPGLEEKAWNAAPAPECGAPGLEEKANVTDANSMFPAAVGAPVARPVDGRSESAIRHEELMSVRQRLLKEMHRCWQEADRIDLEIETMDEAECQAEECEDCEGFESTDLDSAQPEKMALLQDKMIEAGLARGRVAFLRFIETELGNDSSVLPEVARCLGLPGAEKTEALQRELDGLQEEAARLKKESEALESTLQEVQQLAASAKQSAANKPTLLMGACADSGAELDEATLEFLCLEAAAASDGAAPSQLRSGTEHSRPRRLALVDKSSTSSYSSLLAVPTPPPPPPSAGAGSGPMACQGADDADAVQQPQQAEVAAEAAIAAVTTTPAGTPLQKRRSSPGLGAAAVAGKGSGASLQQAAKPAPGTKAGLRRMQPVPKPVLRRGSPGRAAKASPAVAAGVAPRGSGATASPLRASRDVATAASPSPSPGRRRSAPGLGTSGHW